MSMMVSPYAFATGGGSGGVPVVRQTYSGEQITAINNTNQATPTSVLTLNFTPDANRDYVVFWSAEISHASNFSPPLLSVKKDGTEMMQCRLIPKEVTTPPDYFQRGGFFIFSAGSSPSSVSLEMTIVRVGSTGTSSAKRARFTVLRLETGDAWASSTGDDTITSATVADKASLTFTGTGDDYLILHAGQVEPLTGLDAARVRINHGGTTSAEINVGNNTGTLPDQAPFAQGWIRSALSGSQTVKTQYYSSATDTITIRRNYILALNLGNFYNAYATTLGSDNSGTNTTATTALSLTQTPNAGDHLTMAVWAAGGNNTTDSSTTNFIDGGSTIAENIQEQNATSIVLAQNGFTASNQTYTASSRTFEIKRASETAVTTTVFAGAVIAVLQLGV